MKGKKMEITTNNGHEEFGPSELVVALKIENERLATELDERSARHASALEELEADSTRQRQRMESAVRLRQEQNLIANTQVRGLTALVERLNGTIGEIDQADKTDEFFLYTMRKVFAVARIKGNSSEARHVADEMDLMELWEEVMADSQYEVTTRENEDAELTKWRAIRQVIEWNDYSMRNRHPMEGCYTDLWKQASRIAHQAGYCDEFQTIASWFGVPTSFDFRYSGTVRVYVEGYFDIDVEGDTYGEGQPDAYSEIDHVSLRDHMDDLDITAEWQEYSIED